MCAPAKSLRGAPTSVGRMSDSDVNEIALSTKLVELEDELAEVRRINRILQQRIDEMERGAKRDG